MHVSWVTANRRRGPSLRDPTFSFGDLPAHWQTPQGGNGAFASALEAARSELAIEIGRYRSSRSKLWGSLVWHPPIL